MTLRSPTDTDAAELARLFEGQWPTMLRLRSTGAAERLSGLRRLGHQLVLRRQDLYDAFRQDFGKPPMEVETTELLPVMDEIRQARKHLRRWMRPRRVGSTVLTLGTSAQVVAQPRGRCLILGPWNYPLNTLLSPLVSAVAAGNTVMLKPSELTPCVGAVIAEMVQAVFDPSEVAVVHGGVPTAQSLLALPFDHVFFTGSTTVGQHVMATASQHLASVTLELGGRSPVIVDDTADLARAAEVLMWAKGINAGQSCIAPDHVWVHHRVHDAFVAQCVAVLRAQGASSPANDTPAPGDQAQIISTRHAQRLADLLDDARTRGAQTAHGGEVDIDARRLQTTLLTQVPDEAAVLAQEIFGPALPILPYTDLKAVLDHINQGHKPLALYVWSRQPTNVEHILTQTSSGGVCVNHCMLQYVHHGLPFGGVNHSGTGSTHGVHGFRAFSHERAVLRGGPIVTASLMFPPYTRLRLRWMQTLVNVLRFV